MKKVFLAAAAATVVSTLAYAGDVEEHCAKGAEMQNVDPSACECVIDAVGDDAALAEEYVTITSEQDMAGASDALKTALSGCSWE